MALSILQFDQHIHSCKKCPKLSGHVDKGHAMDLNGAPDMVHTFLGWSWKKTWRTYWCCFVGIFASLFLLGHD